MKPAHRILVVAVILATALFTTPPTTAVTHDSLSLEVLVNGVPLGEIRARGATYIEAVRHAEYSLRVTNHSGHRMAVALAVDGLNTIDAKTAEPRRSSKWVLDPWQSVTIEGWQIGPDAARKFFFTSEDRSYGAWLGETANLGVIEAVAYRELVPPPPQPMLQQERSGAAGDMDSAAGAPRAESKQAPAPSDELAATGIGRRVDNPVRRVHMRLESTPAAHLRLRYEYREQLVSLGVLAPSEEEQALARRERARGFDGFDFAPDPWGGR